MKRTLATLLSAAFLVGASVAAADCGYESTGEAVSSRVFPRDVQGFADSFDFDGKHLAAGVQSREGRRALGALHAIDAEPRVARSVPEQADAAQASFHAPIAVRFHAVVHEQVKLLQEIPSFSDQGQQNTKHLILHPFLVGTGQNNELSAFFQYLDYTLSDRDRNLGAAWR